MADSFQMPVALYCVIMYWFVYFICPLFKTGTLRIDGEDGEQPIDYIGLGIKGLLALEQCGFRKKTVALQIIWFDLIVTFVMLLPKKKCTFLPFSLIWKRPTTPRGNTIYCPVFTTLIFEAICLPLLMGFSPIDCSRWELGPLCLICMSTVSYTHLTLPTRRTV